MQKRLSDAERARRYARRSYRADLRYIAEVAYRAGLRAARAAAPVPAVSDTDRLNWIFSAAVDKQTAKNLMTGVFTVKQWRCAVDRHMTPPPVPKEGE